MLSSAMDPNAQRMGQAEHQSIEHIRADLTVRPSTSEAAAEPRESGRSSGTSAMGLIKAKQWAANLHDKQ